MRLICGFVRLDGAPAQPEALQAMFGALTSKGLSPRSASRVEGPAALGVVDFSGRAVELSESRDGTWLAADVRLDRPGELRRTLGLEAAASQDELALAAIERWDRDVPDRLDGDFALASWTPDRRKLLCSRDIMGVRPLCYSYMPGRLFAFASLPRGIHGSGLVPLRLDPVALCRLLIESYYREGGTGFRDIAWVPAGHSLVLSEGHLRLHRAWKPEPECVGRWRGSTGDAAAAMRSLLEDAVACRLPPSGPVATHLSGGLDSSAITVIAARQLRAGGRPLHAYSKLARESCACTAGMPLLDERQYVGAVLAQEPDIRWEAVHQARLDGEGVFEPDFALAGPFADPDHRISLSVAATGSSLLLSGAGGDEGATYNGLGILPELLRARQWNSLRSELRLRAERGRTSMANLAVKHLLGPLLPSSVKALRHGRRGRSDPGSRRRNALRFLSPGLSSQVDEAVPPDVCVGSSAEDRARWLSASLLADRANRWSILAARHGQEFSYPLADRRILDFGLSLPVERLVDQGFARQPFRNAMEGILPEPIRWRGTKFQAFPDVERNIRAALPGLLLQVESLRECGAAADMFDLDAIAEALSGAARHPAAPTPVLLPNGQPELPRPLKLALHAIRSLTIAKYVKRIG